MSTFGDKVVESSIWQPATAGPTADSSSTTQSKLLEVRHVWTIENFSFLQKCNNIASSAFGFKANDATQWRLKLFPCGTDDESRDHLGIYVNLFSSTTLRILAKFSICVFDATRKLLETKTIDVPLEFERGKGWGFKKFMRRDSLTPNDQSWLPSDKLIVLCELSAITERSNIFRQSVPIEYRTLVGALPGTPGRAVENRERALPEGGVEDKPTGQMPTQSETYDLPGSKKAAEIAAEAEQIYKDQINAVDEVMAVLVRMSLDGPRKRTQPAAKQASAGNVVGTSSPSANTQVQSARAEDKEPREDPARCPDGKTRGAFGWLYDKCGELLIAQSKRTSREERALELALIQEIVRDPFAAVEKYLFGKRPSGSSSCGLPVKASSANANGASSGERKVLATDIAMLAAFLAALGCDAPERAASTDASSREKLERAAETVEKTRPANCAPTQPPDANGNQKGKPTRRTYVIENTAFLAETVSSSSEGSYTDSDEESIISLSSVSSSYDVV